MGGGGTGSRRDFLKRGALIVGFAIASRVPPVFAQAEAGPAKPLALNEVDSFLAVGTDGSVTVYSGKVDLGTGLQTALTQMVAEELDVPLASVTIIQGDTALTPDQGTTSGSLSVQNGGMQIRQAAATARQHLVTLAADRLGVPVGDLVIAGGVIRPKSGGSGISYGQLIGESQLALKIDKGVKTKDPASYTLVGKSVPRIDIPSKCTGRFTYLQDLHVDGMVHGRVVRPPAIGATLQSVDDVSVKDIPGLIKVVREDNFLAVVAETEWGAIKAAQNLKAVWSKWEGLPDEGRLWEYVRATKVTKDDVTSNVGDVRQALPKAAKVLRATYDFAVHTHGSIGPSCAIAEIKNGQLTCWTPSQATHSLKNQLAAMMQMPVANVRCIYLEGSGCYGRNGHEDAAGDAALLARAAGRPVRVQWMRADEHGWDPKGCPTLIDLVAAFDSGGELSAWEGVFFIPEGAAGNVPLIAATLAGLPHQDILSPGNITLDSAIPYLVPNIRTVCHRLAQTPLRPSWIRSPGRMQNTFANESFMDELAAASGADPLEFRLRHLQDPRGTELLRHLAALAQWETRPSPQKTGGGGAIVRGRGLAYVKYELYRTYVGAVAEVEVDRHTGDIRVLRFYVVHDCGQVINPDGVKNQIEGNIVQTVSRTLIEQVTWDRSKVTSIDWVSYPILTFPAVPEVVIELINRPNEIPWGAGEPSAAVVPAAVSNAVFDAIGIRLRSVPFRPAKVRRAMQSI